MDETRVIELVVACRGSEPRYSLTLRRSLHKDSPTGPEINTQNGFVSGGLTISIYAGGYTFQPK